MGKESLEKLVAESPGVLEEAIGKWFDSVPEEERDKSVIGFYSSEYEPIVLTPRQIYEGVKSSLEARLTLADIQETTKISATFLERVLKDYGKG